MDTRVEQEVPPDEVEGENGQTEDSALVSYNNRPPPTDTQMLIDKYLGKVDFNMKSEDLDKPWYHEGITRAMAQEILKGKEQGSFLVRPSSQRGSYAMSWVKNNQKEISHSLIHGLFPGFSLKQSPSLEERFWTLQQLVDNCPHLQTPVVAESFNANKWKGSAAKTCSEVVGRIVEKLYANNPALTEIKWNICVLGEGTELFADHPREKRTFVRYCDEEYAAPELLPLSKNGLGLVCQALYTNTTLRSLSITGHEGYLLSFKPDLGDAEAEMIGNMLRVNKTLTQLNLNVNEISDAGAKAIAEGLKFNRSLRRLNLSNNFIGPEGLSHFAELLKTNPVLEDCDVRNQRHHSGMTNFVALSCTENIKQSISLIEDTLRRRAELVSSIGANASPGSVSLSSPARSNFLSVFHGFLSKKKVERRLASHIPGSFLFYLNRYLPNVLFIGVVQDVPHSHGQLSSSQNNMRKIIVHKRVQRTRQGYIFSGDAPLFQHEIEAIEPHDTPRQIVPTLFEFCSWYVASKKLPQEYLDPLPAHVFERYRAVQMLIGLWGVKYVASPEPPAPPTPPHTSSSSSASRSSSSRSSSSSSSKSKSHSHSHHGHHPLHHHYADQPEDKPHSSHSSSSHSSSHSSHSSESSHRSSSSSSHRHGSSRSGSSRSHSSHSSHSSSRHSSSGTPATPPTPTTPTEPHYSTTDALNTLPNLSLSDSSNGISHPHTPPNGSPTPLANGSSSPSSLSNSENGIPPPASSLSDSSNGILPPPSPVIHPTPPSTSIADYSATNGVHPPSSLSSSDPFSTSPTPALNLTPPSSGTESDSNTDSDSNLPPNSSSRANSNPNPNPNPNSNPNPNPNSNSNPHPNSNSNSNPLPNGKSRSQNHTNHSPHTNHANHTLPHTSTRANGAGAHAHNSANVFQTIAYLVHKNKSWLKYPVQIPQESPHPSSR